jgi:hypothetical protein
VEGGTIADVPVNQWVRYEILTHVGDQSEGTWQLIVSWEGEGSSKTVRLTDVPFHHADWRELRWFGMSNVTRSTDRTTYFLDDVEIVNE